MGHFVIQKILPYRLLCLVATWIRLEHITLYNKAQNSCSCILRKRFYLTLSGIGAFENTSQKKKIATAFNTVVFYIKETLLFKYARILAKLKFYY